ncbi:GNAT family N-acetyltransferase [Mucilaginibacter sp. FT3.2]|uniref:GNAT family N-acetyltransferase n=1 Tax=Mucilaginibacter sp. FT3.2 TaxID=2723090 RepID=UPI00160BC08E|nr:GNAT family N-acetyltransferase [Mucilaginibacter sp. FT3.2]MBB6231174.1 ribosomal protein S18 acetylase RimI-like enzyme [Mucilaginibacter sp. FT3.2]
MQHPLDNPPWSALITGNKNFSEGTDKVKFFIKEVSPFAGMIENIPENFNTLYNLLPAGSTVAVFSPDKMEIPTPWKVLNPIEVLQMVYNGPAPDEVADVELIPLQDQHIPQMLALTKLTNPGPFFSRTIDFGHYFGVFNGDELVAMAGRRLQALPYMEVSAVCNHPHHLGKGYASRLIQHQVRLIKADGGIPFLHVRMDNTSAIKVYERLGFVTRRIMHICAIGRD